MAIFSRYDDIDRVCGFNSTFMLRTPFVGILEYHQTLLESNKDTSVASKRRGHPFDSHNCLEVREKKH